MVFFTVLKEIYLVKHRQADSRDQAIPFLDCSYCIETKATIIPKIKEAKMPIPRNLEEIMNTFRMAESMTDTTVKEAMLCVHGLARKSEMWNFPGAELNKQLLAELMHCEAEGELPKHFTLLSAILEKKIPDFFKKLNQQTQIYFKTQKLAFPDIST